MFSFDSSNASVAYYACLHVVQIIAANGVAAILSPVSSAYASTSRALASLIVSHEACCSRGLQNYGKHF